MHKAQITYCKSIKSKFPNHFREVYALDVGSLDINGNNKHLFEDCDYVGLDITTGRNVDIISPVHKYKVGAIFKTVISTEMLEHDKHWKESIKAMYDLVCSGGLLLVTCATTGRREHGTTKTSPHASPATNDYYLNVTEEMFEEAIEGFSFNRKELTINEKDCDLYFYGIKE